MITVIQNILPPPNCICLNLFEIIFIRKDAWDVRSEQKKVESLNHEDIHTRQMRELLYIFFYIIYGLEYLVRLAITFSHNKAYRSISFEVEAYENEHDLDYVNMRKPYAQWRKR